MKILNLDGHYFVEPFRRLGHETLWLGPLAASDVILKETISLQRLMEILGAHGFRPDLVVWADICRPPSVVGIETLPAVTVGYSIDQYCNPWHAPYAAAFDLLLVAQKDYLPMFDDVRIENRVEWAPLFSNPFKDKDVGQGRDIPVSFVGTVDGRLNPSRKAFLDDFKKRRPIVATQGDYVPVYNRSRIVLNQSAVGELNFRMFEAMACGAAVLTEDTGNGLSDLFQNGQDVLLYPRDNAAAAARLADTALADDGLAALARNGKRIVEKHHTSTARARRILDFTRTAAQTMPSWRRAQPRLVSAYMGTAYSMLAVDDALPLTDDLRAFFLRLGQDMRNLP